MRKLIGVILLTLLFANAFTQCPAGYTTTAVNWDALGFLKEGGEVSNAIATNQKFAFGKNRLTIAHNFIAANVSGDNITHTGSTGSYGTGADVQFIGNGTITLTFQSAVNNVKFSVYDIDYNQKLTITALDGSTSRTVIMAKVSGTNLTIGGTTTAPTATAGSTTLVADNNPDGTANVDVAGPITSITVSISQTGTKNGAAGEDGSFWLSDIEACSVTNNFPTAYRQIARPFTNQPGYVLVARNNMVNMVDPATGKAKMLFSDPNNFNINSMAYDPYNRILYFTNSLTSGGNINGSNRTVKKYDFNTETMSVFINDVNTLGIPTFGSGVESGGASFYDGALYLGIEGGSGGRSIAWRIDLDASLNAVSAVQAFGIATTDHDWGDFVINDGILYDWDGSASGKENIFHINMLTGAYVATYGPLDFNNRQASADWNGQLYNIGGASGSTGEIAAYNNNGTINSSTQKIITVNGSSPTGSWGDGGEAFKAKADFGDGPATYDPDLQSPAMHETDANLRLGATADQEWNKTASANADADGGDEDGLPFVTILNQNSGNYLTQVDVFNNTGAPATVAAWVDFNNNGVFESGEGTTATVQTATSVQRIDLFWSGITTSLPAFSNVFMRIRVTSASNLMTRDHPTGYFANGEVEDYKVLVNQATLPLRITNFSVTRSGANAEISWTGVEEDSNVEYTLERSTDTRNWNTIFSKKLAAASAFNNHQFLDVSPATPYSYYRLKYKGASNEVKYTQIKKVDFAGAVPVQISPNPATDFLQIELTANDAGKCAVWLYSIDGKEVLKKQVAVNKGYNKLPLALAPQTPDGVYNATILMNGQVFFRKIVISK